MRRGWIDLLRSLGNSLLGVAEAEAAALKGDLRASGRQLAIVGMLAGAAAFVLFWVVGTAGFVLFQVLTIWLPRWGAASIVLIVFLLLAGTLVLVTRRKLQAIEWPADTVRRHFEDHLDWWQSQILVDSGAGPGRRTEEITGDPADSASDS